MRINKRFLYRAMVDIETCGGHTIPENKIVRPELILESLGKNQIENKVLFSWKEDGMIGSAQVSSYTFERCFQLVCGDNREQVKNRPKI